MIIHESGLVDPASDSMLSGVLCTGDDGNQYVVHGLSTQ